MKRIYTLILILALISTANAAIIDCNSCSDCTSKIRNATAGDTVRLTADLLDCDAKCIDFDGNSEITFDGNGYTINGSRHGIELSDDSDNNIVRNCTIANCRYGIYLIRSDHNTIENVTVQNSEDHGISALFGKGNVIKDSELQGSAGYDFNFIPYPADNCDTTLINVTGSGDRPIGLYNERVDLRDQEYSALYLCNASGSTLYNVTVAGSATLKNNGLRVYSSDDVVLNDVVSCDNFEGISTSESDNVTITGAVCDGNQHYNICMRYAEKNTIRNTNVCGSGQCGVYLFHSPHTTLCEITASKNQIGVKLDTSDSTVINDSMIIDNTINGLSGNSVDNLVYNNYFDNTKNIEGTLICEWNVTPTNGLNIVKGSTIGGNYWNDYTGIDSVGDGIGDTPYDTGHGLDYHPLVTLSPTPTPSPTPSPTPAPLDESIISIGDGTGIVTIPIMVSGSDNVGSVDVTLSYDPSVVDVTGVSDGDMDCTFTNLEHTSEGWIRVGAIQSDNDGLSGQFALLNVDLEPVSSNTQCNLTLSVTTFKDSTPECTSMSYNISNGVYTSSKNGDSNGDNIVDVADAAYIAKHVIGIAGYETIDESAADVNGDGIIDMSDAMYLMKHVIGITGYEELL